MYAFIMLALVLTGCSLVVGTEQRTVAEAGAIETGTADAAADVDTATCKNDCKDAFDSCTAACPHGGPGQKPCTDNCNFTQQNCNSACGP